MWQNEKNFRKFVRNKRTINAEEMHNKLCKEIYKKTQKNSKRSATTGVLPTIFTNLIDSVSHSAVSTIDVFNGYPVGDSPLPFLAHYKPLL